MELGEVFENALDRLQQTLEKQKQTFRCNTSYMGNKTVKTKIKINHINFICKAVVVVIMVALNY